MIKAVTNNIKVIKENIISILLAVSIYLALIWGIPFSLDVQLGAYWSNFGDLFIIPYLIWLFFISKDSLYGFLKDIHQSNLQDIEEQESTE